MVNRNKTKLTKINTYKIDHPVYDQLHTIHSQVHGELVYAKVKGSPVYSVVTVQDATLGQIQVADNLEAPTLLFIESFIASLQVTTIASKQGGLWIIL